MTRARLRGMLVTSLLLSGCASVKIDLPVNGATGVTMPEEVVVTAKGTVTLGRVFLDGQDLSTFNNGNWQFTPRFWLGYAQPGPHSVFVEARNTKTGENLGQTSAFTVAACPLCYSCPTGSAGTVYVHAITGQCCENDRCDVWSAGNSGVTRITSTECQKAVAPGSNEYLYERGCIASNVVPLGGTGVASPSMVAVRFVANQTGPVTHVRVPVDIQAGPRTLRLWLTTDASSADGMGQPGTPLATLDMQNVRQRNLPTRNPVGVFLSSGPVITAGMRYWLVIGAVDPMTTGGWNRSLDDFSIPNTTTLKVNRTSSDLNGPWVMLSNLAEPVPAYEIAVRP